MYVRNFEAIKSNLIVTPGKQLITKKDIHIHIPKRFEDHNLINFGKDIYIYGIYAMIMDNYYCVSNVTTMVNITPDRILMTKIDDVDYYDFHFDANNIVIMDLNVVKNDDTLFDLFNEVLIKGNIPWYMNYSDLGKILDSAKEYTGSSIGDVAEVVELIISLISRRKNDKSELYRLGVNSQKDIIENPPSYISLGNVFYAPRAILNKIAGSYFTDGLKGSLITENDDVEQVERLLRS